MYSPESPVDGCFCCSNDEASERNSNYNIYQTVIMKNYKKVKTGSFCKNIESFGEKTIEECSHKTKTTP